MMWMRDMQNHRHSFFPCATPPELRGIISRGVLIQWECGWHGIFSNVWTMEKPWLFLNIPKSSGSFLKRSRFLKSSRFLYAFATMDLWHRWLWQVLFCAGQPWEMRRERWLAGYLKKGHVWRTAISNLGKGWKIRRLRRESILGDGSNDTMIQKEVQRNAVWWLSTTTFKAQHDDDDDDDDDDQHSST